MATSGYRLNMDPILAAIDAGLKNKNLSDAAASRLAVGHPSLIKNFRANTPGEKRYNVAALQKLADVLDLEFYFGPRRLSTSPEGFAKAAADAFLHAGAPASFADTVRQGYLPLPWHPLTHQPHPPHLMIALTWIETQGFAPEDLSFAQVEEDVEGYGPTLALLDMSAKRRVDPATWCWIEQGELRMERAMFDDGGPVFVLPSARDKRGRIIPPSDIPSLQILGRVVWTSRNCVDG